MWLGSLALAPAQIPATNLVTGAATLDKTGTLFFYGGFLGAEATF
jgi:hypothetical protein